MTTVGRVEITDLLWCRDEHRLRQPVLRSQVVARLEASGQRRAARIVARMPASDDVLDPEHVDVLAVRVHCELQRLAEELQFGRRVAALLRPEVQRLREQAPGPVRVVDVGCGLGFLVRSLAHEQALGPGVELVGVDLNDALVDEAARLAVVERLDCRFVHGDAFTPGTAVDDGARTLVISTGLLHHLTSEQLVTFFRAQSDLGAAVFAHWDIAPCVWARPATRPLCSRARAGSHGPSTWCGRSWGGCREGGRGRRRSGRGRAARRVVRRLPRVTRPHRPGRPPP